MSQADSTSRTHDSGTHAWAIPAPRDLTGRTLGDFKIERLLGHGGMGEVYLAHQVSLDRSIALKVLRPDLLANPSHLVRFEKEALSAAKLNDPNIVHVYTCASFDGLKYIAMEYVPGTNLRDYLARKGVPALPLALSIMRQAGQGIKAAGEVGLIHRDIKPENLLITRKGQVKVADFGLSRAIESQNVQLTQPGVTLGTPMYMSPEQVQGKELDHRSDLYSLGVTFYHMLAGVPPFHADTPLALALKHVHEKPVDLRVHRPDIPPELSALVMKLVAKDPADRYQSATEMLRDLARIKESLQASSAAVSISHAESLVGTVAPTEPAATRAGAVAERAPVSGKPLVAAVLGVALVAGAALGFVARAENLLGAQAPQPSGPPGLWIAPWQTVPEAKTAQGQYHHALLFASEADREAAWLAVPGRFPRQADWSYKAYVQLTRTMLRHRDAQRLGVLSAELARSKLPHKESLAKLADAAAAALTGDAEQVVGLLENMSLRSLDPPLAELALEVVRIAGRPALKVQGDLLDALQIRPLVNLKVLTLDAPAAAR
jgi:serine/threonine-protein kinase